MQGRVDVAILIGRFQPFHEGHAALIRHALKYTANHVLVLIGSSETPRSMKNPWTYVERRRMFQLAFSDDFDAKRLLVEPLPDVYGNDDLWLANARALINKHANGGTVGLLGYRKDSSSYYLNLFAGMEDLTTDTSYGVLSATDIRENYFQRAPVFPRGLVPFQVENWMVDWYRTAAFKYVLDETEWKRNYDKSWAAAPYPPTFVTCDAVITQMGHVLLVERGGQPGVGLLALPGGFVDPHKGDSFDNVLAEIDEETALSDSHGKIPKGKLRGFFTGEEKRFDKPGRSIRGFTLTTAFRFELPPAKKLFVVKGGDDAAAAMWVPIEKLEPQRMFEDHWAILQSFNII